MPIEKIFCSESPKLLSQQLAFDDSLFRFYFVSALQDYMRILTYHNEYPIKQTAYLYLKLSLKPSIFWCDFVISKHLDQILPWRWRRHFQWSFRLKTFFLLKIEIKQNPDCPIKEYNAVFEHIYHNIYFDCLTFYTSR